MRKRIGALYRCVREVQTREEPVFYQPRERHVLATDLKLGTTLWETANPRGQLGCHVQYAGNHAAPSLCTFGLGVGVWILSQVSAF